jgi:cytochrome c556
MIRRWKTVVTITVVASLGGYGALAAAPDIAATVNARKANFKEIGGGFKTINDELKSGAPDMNSVRPLARDIASRAAQTLRFFPRGSGPESGLPTRAKAEIWANQADFVRVQREMIEAANALNTAATADDMTGLQTARTRLGAACKGCHDRYREAT